MLPIPADVIVLPESEEEVLRHALSGEGAAGVPIVVIAKGEAATEGRKVRLADAYLPDSAEEEAVAATLDQMLREKDTVAFAMRRVDPQAQRLAGNENSEWFRSRLGIVGITRVPKARDATELKRHMELSVRQAHALLDTLPEEQLSLEDLWNLLLFVSVPWTQEEAEGDREIIAVIDETPQDTSGSRKIVLWKGRSLMDHLGPMGRRGTLWLPSSPDPLRDELRATARDKAELDALDALFKAKISESDFDRIIRVLGRNVT